MSHPSVWPTHYATSLTPNHWNRPSNPVNTAEQSSIATRYVSSSVAADKCKSTVNPAIRRPRVEHPDVITNGVSWLHSEVDEQAQDVVRKALADRVVDVLLVPVTTHQRLIHQPLLVTWKRKYDR